MKPRSPAKPLAGAIAVLATLAAAWLMAHPGHAPLPTTGVQVDAERGMLTLSPESRGILDLRTEEVLPRVAEEKLLAYATLVAPWQRHAFASTRLPGRLAKLLVRPGQSVVAGQVLAQVQSLELEDLQLEILNAQSGVQLADKLLQQAQTLAKIGAASDMEFREARNKQLQSVNALDIARAKWRSLGMPSDPLANDGGDLSSLPIKAPIAGTVIHADVPVGKVVEATEHLVEIMDLATVWVKIGVLERDLHRVQVGQAVELKLSAFPDETLRSEVQIRGLYLDPQTHLGTVWAELKNPPGAAPRFLPGMNGQAHIVLAAPKPLLTIPLSALVSDGAERYVMVETSAAAKASVYQKRSVVTGVQTDEWVQIVGGEIFAGDRVVTTGLSQLATFFVPEVLRPSAESARNMGLVVEPVGLRVVEDVLEIQGVAESPPDRRAVAASQLPGKIQRIAIERNQRVKQGDVIAEVVSLELQKFQLDMLQAHLQIAITDESVKRLEKLDSIIAQRELWEAQGLRRELVHRRDSLKRKLESVGLSESQRKGLLDDKTLVTALPIRAPRDGIVVHFDKALGQVVKAEEPLFEIQDLSHTVLRGHLSERESAQVRHGQKARVRLVSDPSFVAEGTLVRSGHAVSADSRVQAVWVELDAPPPAPLQQNLLARLTLTLSQPPATLAAPLAAVVREGRRSCVFVLGDDGVFTRRWVETGRADDRNVEIVSGLVAGERIAVAGTTALQTYHSNLR
jgi:cobalt-zinc-cadmium efflux system membrane fusion protein